MHNRDGLDRGERRRRVEKGKNLSVLDTQLNTLIEQTIKISGIVHYYTLQYQQKGHFNDLIRELKQHKEDGTLEPSVALIRIFLENLSQISLRFNQQWRNYPEWYLENILRVKPLPKKGNKIWISLQKIPSERVVVKKDVRFVTYNDQQQSLYYTLTEDLELPETTLEKAYIINLVKDRYKVPEKDLDMVTSLKVRDLKIQPDPGKREETNLKTIGIKLTSPALLLREGQRTVTITFYSEKDWQEKIVEIIKEIRTQKNSRDNAFRNLQYDARFSDQLFKNMFYLTISTAEGWQPITSYTVTRDKKGGGFELTFILDEKFPPTAACTLEKHKFSSNYPKLNIHLNFDAWMYPYSWIKNVLISRIKIKTEVQNISNLQVYNELGRIDISTPFPPFGMNIRKGSWMTVGNYEMAVKNTRKISLDIRWGQLPDDEEGLAGYYRQYDQNIHNASFTLLPRYLGDYEWKKTTDERKVHLFSTVNNHKNNLPEEKAPLYSKTCISGIEVDKMTPVGIPEEAYEYTQQTRSGFVNLSLVSPEMGFGEALYQKIFVEQLMKNSKGSKQYPVVNPPIHPVIERITLAYEAEDTIDLQMPDGDSTVDYILPVDTLTHFPERAKQSVSFAIQLDDTNLLLALKNPEPGKELDVFFEFISEPEETASFFSEPVQWYIGHMRNWKEIEGALLIQKEETMQLSVSGRIRFRLPFQITPDLYDHENLLWIRAGIKGGKNKMNLLRSIALNPVLLQLDEETLKKDVSFHSALPVLTPEKTIPGVIAYHPLTAFFEGRPHETITDRMIRISEYITHRGRAVTPRDYERLLLQEFTDIGKVLCYSELEKDSNGDRVNVVLAVLPAAYSEKPLVSNYTMIKAERYLNSLSTQYIGKIKITNPAYEQVLVRIILQQEMKDKVGQKALYFSKKSTQDLIRLINSYIVPWKRDKELPVFGYRIPLEKMYRAIERKLKIEEISIDTFQIFCFRKKEEGYKIYDYHTEQEEGRTSYIAPDQANTLFIPATDHIVHVRGDGTEFTETFGIDEMKLGDTFII